MGKIQVPRTKLAKHIPQIAMCFGVKGMDLNRPAITIPGRLEPTLLVTHNSKIVVGSRYVRIQCNGAIITTRSATDLLFGGIDVAQQRMVTGNRWIQLDRAM